MPDVKAWFDPSLLKPNGKLNNITPATVKRQIKGAVATHMDCFHDNGSPIVHDPKTQITVLTFEPIADPCNKLFIVHILAFPWEDRMANLDERLREIGLWVRGVLELPPKSVDVSFIPIPRLPRPGWVNV